MNRSSTMSLGRWLVIVASCYFALVATMQAQQTLNEPPLVDVGRVPVDLGYPRLNLGYPTQNIIDPEVGKVVRLAQGFDRTPDFTYSFTHPLAQFESPFVNRGPYGTFNAPFEPANVPNNRLKLTPPTATHGRPAVLDAQRNAPATTIKFLPAPWLLATQKAKYVPQLGVYAHHATDQLVKGAYITGIGINGVGHSAGLLPGDVITSINGRSLISTGSYKEAIDQIKNPWTLKVWNSHTNRTTSITSSGD